MRARRRHRRCDGSGRDRVVEKARDSVPRGTCGGGGSFGSGGAKRTVEIAGDGPFSAVHSTSLRVIDGEDERA